MDVRTHPITWVPSISYREAGGHRHAPGCFGVESLDLYKAPSFSLSPLALAVPRSVTGMSASLELGAGFRYTQFLVHGWDCVEDVNDGKTSAVSSPGTRRTSRWP